MTTNRNFLKPTSKMALMTGVTTVLAGGVLAGTQPASAVTIQPPAPGEPSLQEEFDSITTNPGDIDAQNDQTGYELFTNTAAGSTAQLMFENAGLADENEFGIYEAGNKDNKATLFEGSKSPGELSSRTNFDILADGSVLVSNPSGTPSGATTGNFNNFGFYLSNGAGEDNTFYSEASLNPDDKQQSVVYQGDGNTSLDMSPYAEGTFTQSDIFISFEDLARAGDNGNHTVDSDFNDMGVVVSDVEAKVPEPSAMAALGLVGGFMAFARRRRQ